MNSSLVERFSCELSWPSDREIFLSYSRQGFTWVNSSLAERFSFELSAGIHLGEFFLGQEVFL